MNLYNKYYNQALYNFKTHVECLDKFDNRVLKTSSFCYNNRTYIDLNFKYLVELGTLLNDSNKLFKSIKLETVYNRSHISSSILNNQLNRKLMWSIIKLAHSKKYFLLGKTLNFNRKHSVNGLSVGLCGFVGFLPESRSFEETSNSKSIFVIKRYNNKKKRLRLSTRRVHKIILKVLFKLVSKIVYGSKKTFNK